MKIVMRAMLLLALVAVAFPPQAGVANLEWLGRVSGLGGFEREGGGGFRWGDVGDSGQSKAAIVGSVEALGVVPFSAISPMLENFGFEGQFSYAGGRGSRFNLNVAPVFAWNGGKIGVFYHNQWRNYPDGVGGDKSAGNDPREFHFAWIRPAVSLYFPQMNVDISMNQPVVNVQYSAGYYERDSRYKKWIPQSQLRGVVNYFPTFAEFITKDNLELSLGVEVNSFSGSNNLQSGVGPVLGIAILPMRNLELTVVKGNFDNRGRYQFISGLQYYFDSSKVSSTLLQLRRKYLDPTNLPGRVSSVFRGT
jgi:hypothetical protein